MATHTRALVRGELFARSSFSDKFDSARSAAGGDAPGCKKSGHFVPHANQWRDAINREVCIVDDDTSTLSAISKLLRTEGFHPQTYLSGEMLLNDRDVAERAACIILDLSLAPMTGIEAQARLRRMSVTAPIVFLSGTADISMVVKAMRDGAADFIEKPFNDDDLILRVRRAIREDAEMVSQPTRGGALSRLGTLTPREREVLSLVSAGLTSKEIGRQLSCSHRTIEVHRHRIMEKSGAESLADLVRLHIASRRSHARSAPQGTVLPDPSVQSHGIGS